MAGLGLQFRAGQLKCIVNLIFIGQGISYSCWRRLAVGG